MWATPKTNWNANTGIDYDDLNRMEGNTKELRDYLESSVFGFDINAGNQTNADAGIFTIGPGECVVASGSNSKPPVVVTGSLTKNLTAFTAGNNNGSKAPGSAAFSAGAWWYVFLLYNSVTGAHDIAIDSAKAGTNAASIAGFDRLRVISTFQIRELSGPVYAIIPIVSRGDTFYYVNNDALTNDISLTSRVRFQKAFSVTTATGRATYTESMVNSLGHKLMPPMNIEALVHVIFKIAYAAGADMASLWGGAFSNIEGGTYPPAGMLQVTVETPTADSIYRSTVTPLRLPLTSAGQYVITGQAVVNDIQVVLTGFAYGFVWDRRTTN
jgi:hypothetical protein